MNSFEYSYEEDQFLAYCCNIYLSKFKHKFDIIYIIVFKYGYGSWELIKNEFRNNPNFMFNWAVKCRSNQDVQKRSDYLVGSFKRDIQIAQIE